MAMRPHVRRDKRQAALLAAVQAAPDGRWKSGRAVGALRQAGWPVTAGTASGDLQALVTAGHLARREETGVVWYEPTGCPMTRLYPAVYIAAITAAGALATWLADFLPISSPTTAWAVNVAAGCLGVLAATTWLPCPCHHHRKDVRP